MTTPYDEVPYESQPFYVATPEHLATVGTLFGLSPLSPSDARLLEIGCGTGAHIVALAAAHPSARFVGLDASSKSLDVARKMVAKLGLQNIEFVVVDLSSVDNEALGRFDYIVGNGVYSWLPPRAQEGMLGIYANCLTEQGVGYISHNTLPGWHFRRIAREMCQLHTRDIDEPKARVEQARALLEFLSTGITGAPPGWRDVIEGELRTIRERPYWFAHHDLLAEHNGAVYFTEMMERIRPLGLQFLADASIRTMFAHDFEEATRVRLAEVAPSIHAMEQYLDFLRGRMYRQTLLCRSTQSLSRHITWEKLRGLSVRAALQISEPFDRTDDVPATFRHESGFTVNVRRASSKRALELASQAWPMATTFSDLVARVAELEGRLDDDTLASEVGGDFLEGFVRGAVELTVQPPEVLPSVSEWPCAFPYAREQAKLADTVTNVLHRRVALDSFCIRLLPLVDGTQTLEELTKAVEAVPLPANAMNHASAVRDALTRFARTGLLIA